MNIAELKQYIKDGGIDEALSSQCALDPNEAREKYLSLCDGFEKKFGSQRDVFLLSVGGRTEVSGNHTDHNKGKVMAAAVNLELTAVAAKREDGVICVKSEGYPEDEVSPEAAEFPDTAKYFTSASLIAGMENAFMLNGYAVGGFDAYTVSSVLKGSGLSSSAAFEVMIGNILNHLYNGGRVPNEDIAKMAQYSENVFFGKPCGLMDQMACAVGGFISIDFKDTDKPQIKKLSFDLDEAGYALCIVNTGGNHADLNEDYASVPAEMKSVARLLGKDVLRSASREELIKNAALVREKAGDRAYLRAMHYFAENDRVDAITKALSNDDIPGFLCGIKASGDSSFKYLQNVYTVKNVREQGISLALCMTESYFAGRSDAAWRVHGGGFAGTIQVFVPKADAKGYAEYIEGILGKGSCHMLSVRGAGAICLAK